MGNEKNTCPIWGTTVESVERHSEKNTYIVVGSPRAGGDYEITDDAIHLGRVSDLAPTQKAKLTTFLIDARRMNKQRPLVTYDLVAEATRADSLPVYTRAERLLRYLVNSALHVGQSFRNNIILGDLEALAWSESTTSNDISYFINYLTEMEWLRSNRSGGFIITVHGYEHVATQARKTDPSQCFVAMWIDDSMNSVLEDGIEKAVRKCGYTPRRIDKKHHFNKICDEAIAEIRRSRFVVADFTHGTDGARGSVFYEAGFAHALGLPVIFSCKKGPENPLHFDTRQYPHILWKDEDDLYIQLKDKIGALIEDDKAEPAHAVGE